MVGHRRITWFALCVQLTAVFIAGGLHDHRAGDCCHDGATAEATVCQASHADHASCSHASHAKAQSVSHSRADGFQRVGGQADSAHGCLACQYLSLASITLPACQLTLEQPLNPGSAIAEFELVLLSRRGAFSSRAPPQGELLSTVA